MLVRDKVTSANTKFRLFGSYLCASLLLFNVFSVLNLSPISVVNALEGDSESVVSFLPSFNSLMFWRADRNVAEDKTPIAENIDQTEHVLYEVNDMVSLKNSENSKSNLFETFDKNPQDLFTRFSSKMSKNISNKKKYVSNKDNRICHSCNKGDFFGDENEEYRQRIEYIKEQILTRLGMKEPPKLKSSNTYMTLAEHAINKLDLMFDFRQEPKNVGLVEDIEKAIVLPMNGNTKSPVFNLSSVDTSSHNKAVKSVHVYVKYNLTEYYYKTLHDDTDLMIASVPLGQNNILEDFGMVSPIKREDEKGFDSNYLFQYDVTNILNDSSGLVRIYNENFDILSSGIVIEMTNNKFIRTKRSLDCTENISFCCRQHFYVNFTTIGWDNWIFEPSGYNANYCKGKCDLSHARYHHTTVIGKYPVIKLCCSPREMSSISLIYMDGQFNIYQKNLPNMVVESCDCA